MEGLEEEEEDDGEVSKAVAEVEAPSNPDIVC